MTDIYKQWKKIKEKVALTLDDWTELETFIWKQQMKIEELTKSRDLWEKKYKDMKQSYLVRNDDAKDYSKVITELENKLKEKSK